MKKERIEYLVDSFIDVNGDTRHFVIAAISEVLPKNYKEIDEGLSEGEISYGVALWDESDEDFVECTDVVVKGLKLGWAICNPTDKFDENLGIKIAIGRARANAQTALYATELGYINTKVVKAFLEQEAEYFKANPESKIAGFKRK